MQVRDPVCGMMIDTSTAPERSTYRAETYYFCSKADKEAFDENPEEYIAHPHEAVSQ